MTDSAPVVTAVILSTDAAENSRLGDLIEILERLEINVETTDSVANAAAAVVSYQGEPACILIHSRGQFTAIVAALRAALPAIAPIVLLENPRAGHAIAAFRSGAGDVLELESATETTVARSVRRACQRYRVQRERRIQLGELRDALDEFLRAVVQTERRSIDLENQLAAHKSGTRLRRSTDEGAERRPVVLVVERDRQLGDLLVDRLEDMGVVTFAFVSGEEAVIHSKQLAATGEPIDLAVIDADLPGMTGLDTLAKLKDRRPYLSAIVLGDRPKADEAVAAAQLGVVGYVRKPMRDTAHVLERIREQAIDNQQTGRERHYLTRIKLRHESVLTRYRQLRSSLDEWEF